MQYLMTYYKYFSGVFVDVGIPRVIFQAVKKSIILKD